MIIKVTLMYDGSSFYGWQKQTKLRSVQQEIEDALSKITKVKTVIHGSGRTDAGVHALGQVFHFETDLDMPDHAWRIALNNATSEAIVILDAKRVEDSFHARFSATGKVYEYRLNVGTYNPFERHLVYQYNKALDVQKMREAMAVFIGTHDFTTYNNTRLDFNEHQVRTIHAFDLIEEGNTLIFRIDGSGFLRYMVRMLVATVVACGSGQIDVETIKRHLAMKDKQVSKYNIDACGLYLVKVRY